ncbi:ESX secretion-associated protein EspG [Kutzneria buriramensis]|uniref:ESAT-6 protein secretion system EspG family protein n=1 Tax=Kutzneria buriramensis TaxID=1045776 RepID=A0A3E0IAW6_9PSEU|nr:ESX secretion-associated protein EspG [Kutzneria buriramensis]REH55741.1 ESAT-6 protein secretion system EspG family protein [Kutzneria buriramensis]
MLTLSELEFDVLWEHLRLPEMPLAIKVASPGKTHVEREDITRTVWDSLADRGLVGGSRGIDEDLVDLLGLLDQPDCELDARLWLDGGVRALVAAKGSDAVLARLADGCLTLTPVEVSSLPRAALSLLPELPAGPGYSITVPSADLDAAAAEAETADELGWILRDHGVSPDEADELAAMVGNVRRRGQFGAAARDQWGRRHRPDRVIGFFDTPRGRYVQIRRAKPGGVAWSTVAPADDRRLDQHITALLNDAVGLTL